ncbi:type IV toxin-antitoxin system AbiEi family antitoxin domain-containing protein [Gandjariella thermophila]|uniref:type IV toxin-antitoxin system AbiEi family antitoxin domain-containing protein n=1 Tax=Gandjariella thermophila TaxID=1931992 RepID=UPI0010F47A59|nr:type IV toxin-antitoxin system AbiEi family antitoxin domain-containing protein [Gandjariella thermophila]
MRTSRQDRRRAVAEVAARQHGYFTAAQALRLGCTYQNQKFHVDHGNWIRVERGLFRLREWPVSDDDHLVRAWLWAKGQAVVSHQSALAAHNLGDVDPAKVHLSVPPGFRRKSDFVVLHHVVTPPEYREDRGAYTVTTVPRAIAECAAEAMPDELLASAVIDALQQGRTTRRRLRDAAAALGDRAELGVERALRTVDE